MTLDRAFDAIVEEMAGHGSGLNGFDGAFTHERSPANGHLTAALFAAKALGAEGLNLFFEKGGRFTTQCDMENRNVLTILWQRVEDAITQQNEQAQQEIAEAFKMLESLIDKQGGLIPIQEENIHRVKLGEGVKAAPIL